MNSFEANIRNSSTKGEVNKLRNTGFIPCILYGGKEANQKLSINKIGEIYGYIYWFLFIISIFESLSNEKIVMINKIKYMFSLFNKYLFF